MNAELSFTMGHNVTRNGHSKEVPAGCQARTPDLWVATHMHIWFFQPFRTIWINAVRNMLVRKFPFAPIEANIQLFKSYCYPSYECALWHYSYQNSIRKLTVSFSDTFKRLINVPRYTSSSLAFATNSTDHVNVVFRKFAYSLMSRVTASPNSIVSAIVNSDAYHQSPLLDKWESMLYL